MSFSKVLQSRISKAQKIKGLVLSFGSFNFNPLLGQNSIIFCKEKIYGFCKTLLRLSEEKSNYLFQNYRLNQLL